MDAVEISTTAESLSKVLLPYLPYLIKGGKLAGVEAFKAIGKKFGESGEENLKQLWSKLTDKLNKKPEVVKSIEKVSAKPDHPKSENALAFQLEEILEELEQSALEEIKALLESVEVKRIVIASRDRSVAVGGDADGATIITGNSNIVDK